MTPTEAVEAVCKHYGIGRDRVLGKFGSSVVAEPRLVLMVLWRDIGLGYDEIGERMGISPSAVYYRWQAVQSWHREAAGEIRKEADRG